MTGTGVEVGVGLIVGMGVGVGVSVGVGVTTQARVNEEFIQTGKNRKTISHSLQILAFKRFMMRISFRPLYF